MGTLLTTPYETSARISAIHPSAHSSESNQRRSVIKVVERKRKYSDLKVNLDSDVPLVSKKGKQIIHYDLACLLAVFQSLFRFDCVSSPDFSCYRVLTSYLMSPSGMYVYVS